jgi:hypothetical protein
VEVLVRAHLYRHVRWCDEKRGRDKAERCSVSAC